MDSLKKIVIPSKLPMLFIDDNVLLPGVQGKITIQDKGSLQLIKEQVLMKESFQNCIIGIFPKAAHKPPFNKDELVGNVGTAGLVLSLVGSQLPTLQYVLTVKGVCRILVKRVITAVPYPLGEVVEANDFQVNLHADQPQQLDESIQEFKDLMNELFDLQEDRGYGVRRFKSLFHSVPDDLLPDMLVSVLKATFDEKEEILRSLDLSERFKKAAALLLRHVETLRRTKQANEKKKGGKGKSSGPSSFLREFAKGMNINGIKLGRLMGSDVGDEEDDTEQLEAKISEANMPEYARKEALKELKRLKKIPAHFPDHAPIRHYLEWMVDLPWDKRSEDTINIEQARHDLDADHYGLTELKKRIIEYLAVRKLKNTLKGPILCFVGPPGVGKTSVGKSIANILGRKFQRISLGGACDQSDIRGHRRTYIGSMPGRILTAVKNAGTRNPVILLDEIDKLGKGIHGDPAAALLEVLDPEQNHTFTDHYLNIPFDLSEILFIATANSTSPICSALLDRMELLEVSGYTVEEKVIIALKYLVPKQLQEHGLKAEKFGFSEEALKSIITHYTREAGVRSLERKIGAVCRVLAVEAASNGTESGTPEAIMVQPSRLERILGPEIYVSEIVQRLSMPGVAIGLAWTAMGGEIMFVEASKMGGDGTLSLTGQLGEVMKESAQLALSWIRSRSVELGFTDEAYRDLMENTDVHVHFPAGAVGKDGPSAGVAITTALVSLFSGRCLRSDTAMTGEITLRGLILPVGGIKEKVLAAHRVSINRVILPSRNKKDMQKIPSAIRDEMEIIFVDRIEDVLQEIFDGGYNMMLSQDLISKL